MVSEYWAAVVWLRQLVAISRAHVVQHEVQQLLLCFTKIGVVLNIGCCIGLAENFSAVSTAGTVTCLGYCGYLDPPPLSYVLHV